MPYSPSLMTSMPHSACSLTICGHGVLQGALVGRLVVGLAGLLGAQELLQLRRPDQAADMGGEDAVRAALHGVPILRRLIGNRYQVDATMQMQAAPGFSAHRPAQCRRGPARCKDRDPKPFLNGKILPSAWGGPDRKTGTSGLHGSHRFQPSAFPRHRRQRAHAPHRPHAAAWLRRARSLRGGGRRGRSRRLHPLSCPTSCSPTGRCRSSTASSSRR